MADGLVWGSGMGTPMPGPSVEPGREYTPTSVSRTFTPSSNGGGGGTDATAKWDAYVKTLGEAMAASSGFARDQLEAQMRDAQKGRQNAYKIAQLSAETSRYGVDVGRENLLAQLEQNQRQFDANHALEMQKLGLSQQQFGLDVANAYTHYASTPDLTFQRADLMEGLDRAGIGQGPPPLSTAGTPHAKTWNDWAALQGWATPTVQAGQSQPPAAGAAGASGGGEPSAGGTGTDPRITASNAIMKAVPPSDDVGHDQSDFAALRAIQNLYLAPKPGALQKLRPGQQAAVGSGLSRLGYYAPDALYDIKQAGVGQGNPRSL